MDILCVAAAIFSLSGLLRRYYQPLFSFSCPPLCDPKTQLATHDNNRLLCVSKPYVYSQDCLKALKPLISPPPDLKAVFSRQAFELSRAAIQLRQSVSWKRRQRSKPDTGHVTSRWRHKVTSCMTWIDTPWLSKSSCFVMCCGTSLLPTLAQRYGDTPPYRCIVVSQVQRLTGDITKI